MLLLLLMLDSYTGIVVIPVDIGIGSIKNPRIAVLRLSKQGRDIAVHVPPG